MKRVYESASLADGVRVLVDRIWPRGLSKSRAAVDEWLRDLAPSNELRLVPCLAFNLVDLSQEIF